MTAEVDPLAMIIWGHPTNLDNRPSIMVDANSAHLLAKKIREAGYRKAEAVATEEELDALPFGCVVKDNDGDVYRSGITNGCTAWWQAGPQGVFRTVALPAIVIHNPEEQHDV